MRNVSILVGLLQVSLRRRSLVACFVGACVSPSLNGLDLIRTYTSQTLGYTVRYPGSWHPEILSGVFYIENFPPSEAVRAIRLPRGGAGIRILVPDQVVRDQKKLPDNLEEFAKLNTSHDNITARGSFELGDGTRKLSVLEVRTECCAVPPYQESVDWYFESAGKMFVASLTYWKTSSNTDRLRETLRQIVLSLRVIPKTALN